jgi:UDP-N-acetylmuramyl tripeptide synthase
VLEVGAFPLGMNGAARFNIANALGAICVAEALGLPVEAMRDGLAGFTGSPDENPGRGNFIELGGVTVVVDFAHNPHGVAALLEALATLPAKRRAVLLGQAGDRSDADTAEMTRVVWAARPDLVVVKELPGKLRGREPGELPAVIAAELRRLGAPDQAIALTGNEIEATRYALEWARPGDLLVVLIHEDRQPVMELLASLQLRGWQPGQPLDAPA